MLISDLIAKLQEFKAAHGDLEVQIAVPEGDYTRLEGDPTIFNLGYSDDEGNYLTEDAVEERIEEWLDEDEDADEDDVRSNFEGPFLCIGAEGF